MEHPVLSWMTLPSIPSSLRSDQGVPDWPFLWEDFMSVRKKTKLVHGVGRNDADYQVHVFSMIGGTQKLTWQCPFYRTWKSMIDRCYSAKRQTKRPTYAGCTVVPEWHSFSAFREWMVDQSWDGMQLDKDILDPGNRVYSPDTCVFVSSQINSFMLDCSASQGEWPVGVSWSKRANKFRAMCSNPFSGRHEIIGCFTCPDAAHEAWRKRKHEHACRYADMQTDQRIAQALRIRYAKQAGEIK